MPSKDKYTDPELRDEVKEEIHNSDKGGAPGQWSARKAQMMASEYKKRGGGYTTDKKDKEQDQKNLDNWTEEEWQTKEGSGHAKKEDGTEKRYLPKKAWEQMSEKEKEETDEKKQDASKEGKQHVSNTSKAKSARKNASKDGDHEQQNGHSQNSDKKNAQDCTQHWEDAAHRRQGEKEYQKFKDQDGKSDEAEEEAQSESAQSEDQGNANTKKRGRGANQSGSNKKQKNGSSDGPNGAAGDKTRVPKKGQSVQWKALPGYVDGEVVEVVYEEKTIEGKSIKASKEDPRIVLKSASSGKICVHKPEAVFFE